jgi:hypothetical protein
MMTSNYRARRTSQLVKLCNIPLTVLLLRLAARPRDDHRDDRANDDHALSWRTLCALLCILSARLSTARTVCHSSPWPFPRAVVCCLAWLTPHIHPAWPARRAQGVGIATVRDAARSRVGALAAAAAVATTVASQLATRQQQRRHGLSPLQLLHAVAPAMAATLLGIGLPLDVWLLRLQRCSSSSSNAPPPLLSFSLLSLRSCGRVCLLTCALAVAVNASTFAVIGRCPRGPLSYQVLGHVKTLAHLALCVALAARAGGGGGGGDNNARVVAGAALAMVGVLAYALETRAASSAAAAAATGEAAGSAAPAHRARS